MPRNPSGTNYTVPNTFAPQTKIYSAQANQNFQDIGQELVNSLPRDGRAPMAGALNMNGNRLTGLPEPSEPGDAVPLSQIQDLGVAIGDFKDSIRDLSPNWLRRNGALLNSSEYPELAALLPPLPDGVLWSLKTTGAASLSAITAADARFVAVGGSAVASSFDAELWSLSATIADATLNDIVFGNGVFLTSDIGNRRIYTSPNALDWSLTATLSSAAIAVGYFPEEGLFYAAGGSGYLAVSDDATSWSALTSGISGGIQKIRHLNGRMVAAANGGYILHSVDGQAWTAVQVPGVSAGFADVAYKDGVYVAVGVGGMIYTSPNLTTWTQRISGVSTSLNAVVAGETGFLAAGNNGVARISSNGVSWAAAPVGVTSNFSDVVIDPDDGNRYVVVGLGTNAFIGLRTQPTQFRVPNDNPTYGWIRAV